MLYHGLLAPHYGWRARVVTYGAPPAVASPDSEPCDTSRSALRHWAWAALIRRDVDVLASPRCGGRLRLIATVEDPEAIPAILAARTGSRGGEAGAAGRARGASQSRGGARRLSGIRTPRSRGSAGRRLGAGASLWTGALFWQKIR